jgi:hypothetical protein
VSIVNAPYCRYCLHIMHSACDPPLFESVSTRWMKSILFICYIVMLHTVVQPVPSSASSSSSRLRGNRKDLPLLCLASVESISPESQGAINTMKLR